MNRAYYAVIPAPVLRDEELKANVKLLYGDITALCNERGYCWASNSYLADLYGVHKNTAGKWVNELIEQGYLHSEITYKEGTSEIQERRLYLTPPINQNVDTYQSKRCDPINQNVDTPINQNVEDNNTSFNTTVNTTLDKKIYTSDFEKFWSIYPKKIDKKRASKSFKTVVKKYDLETILKGTRQYAEFIRKNKTETQFIKHASTFLNNDSFLNDFNEGGAKNEVITRVDENGVKYDAFGCRIN